MAKLNGADYLLLLLYLDNKKPILGAIRLEKMMFLFNMEIAPILKEKGLESDKLPEFIAYNYGPFSKDVYEQVELFKGIKFIQVTDLKATEEMVEVDDLEEMSYEDVSFVNEMTSKGYKLKTDGTYYKYSLLKTGENYVVENILPSISNEQKILLETFKKKITSIYPKQLLKYVYSKYPDYTTKSLIKDKVLDDE